MGSSHGAAAAGTPTSKPEYVLGTGDDELSRLAFQHRLWSDAAHEGWRTARIGLGQRVLDIGSGPGFASFDLAQLVGPTGSVVGVDESVGFINYLNDQARLRGLPNATGIAGDVHALRDIKQVVAGGPYDLAYARWVLCFVSRPDEVVRQVASLLKPGGRFVVHDYFNYETMRIAPRGTAFAKLYELIVNATGQSWRARGGDPDIVGRLPGLMHAAGLNVTSMRGMQRIARPGETMFHWVGTWWRNYVPKLAEMGAITIAHRDEFFKGWAELEQSRDSWIMMPCVYEVIAEK